MRLLTKDFAEGQKEKEGFHFPAGIQPGDD
jgi:hypothetical protein